MQTFPIFGHTPFSGDPAAASERYSRAMVKTDADGRFQIAPLRAVKVFQALGDELHSVSLVIKDRGRIFLGFSDIGRGNVAKSIKETCDLARPVQTPPSPVYDAHGRLKKSD